ncbi:MAG: hypothetical protein IJG80_10210 [Selenomonadaceae bacterium]|nr:hypothetical protein [Selenomonadaceae bacterium]MBQ3726966.1 hypothetical protein [Selenomonadaceae bacterium]MBQ9497088.1 hypothetical protein [Selenomonadaceae bacterium]
MKKFFAAFALVLMTALVSFAPQAAAEVHIDFFQTDLHPESNEVIFQTKMRNTLDKPVVVTRIDIRSIKLFDEEGNLLWQNAATFDNINISIPANGEVQVPVRIYDAPAVPNYNGEGTWQDDTWIEWVIAE